MERKYDVVIVGAGPAGVFACYELLKKHTGLKIAIVDMGNSFSKRMPSEVMSGFGGAGTYSDGKLHFTPKLSHERTFHIIDPEEYQKILDYIDTIFTDEFKVKAVEYPRNKDEVQLMVDEAERKGIELIVRRAKHVGTNVLREVIGRIEKNFIKRGVDLIMNTKVVDLLVEKGRGVGVLTEEGERILGDKILLSPGRVSAKWLQEWAEKQGIKYQYDMVEVGVRVEIPASVMRRYAEALYEIVFKIRTVTYDDIMRTFCTCPNGFVTVEKYRGFVCVNGHSYSDNQGVNSNFAFVAEVHLTEPVENSIAYAESIAQVTSTIGGGKPILQRLADLRRNRRSTKTRLANSLVRPSLSEVTPGDIAMALPHRIVVDILEGLTKLDEVMPGVNDGSTLLYAPEVKFRSSKVTTTPDMQTTLPGVYVAGDASGMSGTITGAAATGIMAARGMMRESGK